MEVFQMEKNKVSILLMVVMLVMAAGAAFGFTEPTSGSFANEVKELTVDDIIKGAIGFTIVVAGIAWGGYNILAKGQWLMGVGSMIGGAVIGLSPTIATGMGILY
jgi:hypothetical protein